MDSLFEQVSSMIMKENEKLLNDPDYLRLHMLKPAQKLNTHEPDEAHACDNCQKYSSRGFKFGGKWFCDNACFDEYRSPAHEFKGQQMMEQEREAEYAKDNTYYEDQRDKNLNI